MTGKEKDQLVKNYEPLINKLVGQFHDAVKCPWNDLKSMAYEGFALALKNYDPNKSSMTFMQYAAFSIRNNILSSLDVELRTVKLSAYAQEQITKLGASTFNTVSIDQPYEGDDELKPREMVMGMYENEKFSNGDVFEYLYNRIDHEFNERDRMIFYKVFGLNGQDETPNKDIAKEYGVSEGLISQRLKKVITFIKHDKELCEMLGSLVH